MTKAEQQRKRRAAWAVLEPYLSGNDLLAAIGLLNTYHQESSMASLIRYINEVGKLTGKLDQATQKSIYPKYYQLLNDRQAMLPKDPLPLLQGKNRSASKKTTTAKVNKLIDTVQALSNLTASASTITPPMQAEAEIEQVASAAHENPELSVFTFLTQRLLDRFPKSTSLFLNTLSTQAEQSGLLSSKAAVALNDWIDDSKEYPWPSELDENDLTSIVQLLYQSVCASIGTRDADQLFLLIFKDCDEIPESREFPPTLFL